MIFFCLMLIWKWEFSARLLLCNNHLFLTHFQAVNHQFTNVCCFYFQMSLIAQDMALFQQLFALQEAILDFKGQFEECTNSSETSPFDSPCSTLSSLSSDKSGNNDTKVSNYFQSKISFFYCGLGWKQQHDL
jgi:hypothetical protein